MNTVCLIGNLTRDVELRYLSNGKAVGETGIAVNERYKSGDEWKDSVSFFELTIWAGQAESASKYLSKGSKVSVEGRLRQERWEDRDGKNRSKVTITVSRLDFIDKPQNRQNEQPQEDEIPF